MLLFVAVLLFSVALLIEKNGQRWFRDPVSFLTLRISFYFVVVSYGVVILLHLSYRSLFTLVLLLPWVFLALWQLVRLASAVWPHRLAPWLLLLFLLFGSWGFRTVTPARIHPVMLVEYILDESPAVPRPNSIDPEVHRLVRI